MEKRMKMLNVETILVAKDKVRGFMMFGNPDVTQQLPDGLLLEIAKDVWKKGETEFNLNGVPIKFIADFNRWWQIREQREKQKH
jgi:hypothetical protein